MGAGALGAAAIGGLAAGILAGLFGIGGGAILVPLLYVLLDRHTGGTPADARTVIAHASSLAIIVPTALSALLRYQASSLVPWRIVWVMGGAAAVVSAATTLVTPQLPEFGLRAGFAVFLVVIGLRMLRAPGSRQRADQGNGVAPTDPDASATEAGSPSGSASTAESGSTMGTLLGGGGLVGFIASALGVGGGTMAIPILMGPGRVEVRRVAAASMGIVAFASIAGTAAYLLARPASVPTGTIGYVFVPGVVVMAPGAVIGARWGAALNARIAPERLRRLFALLLLTIAARMILRLAGLL